MSVNKFYSEKDAGNVTYIKLKWQILMAGLKKNHPKMNNFQNRI